MPRIGFSDTLGLRMQLLIEDCCQMLYLHTVFFPPCGSLALEATPGLKKGATRRMIPTECVKVKKTSFYSSSFFLSFLFLPSKMSSLGGILACVTQRPTTIE